MEETMKRLLFFVLPLFFAPQAAQAVQVPGPLVDTAWLEQNLDKVVVLDVRDNTRTFTTKSRSGEGGISGGGGNACGVKTGPAKIVVSGHIPNAVLVPWNDVRVKRKVDGVELDKMLPEKAGFEKLMQQSSVNSDSAVVIATNGEIPPDVFFGTRLYWQLKYFGHDNVAMLDGGTAKWIAERRKISYDKSKPGKGNFQARAERKEMLATTADVQQAMQGQDTQLIDSRTLDFYLGLLKKEPFVAAKGHIPGAKVYPYPLLTSPEAPSTFRVADELKQLTAALGIDPGKPGITYCDTGHLSSGTWFIMSELLGNKGTRLYDGSMHEWTKDTSRPVATMKME
jgi:thiosulfate/3-mercaptopyruvate sulfurtransferase